ncbi:MAG: hypothetical protein V7722_09140 [Porticoccus sp.]
MLFLLFSACSGLAFAGQNADKVTKDDQEDFCKGWEQGIKMIKGNHLRKMDMPKCPNLLRIDADRSAFREGLKAGRKKASFRAN